MKSRDLAPNETGLRPHFPLQHRHSLLELKAPQAGIVKDLATHTPGTVVAPGTILLTLVPHDEPLVAEVWVENIDAGFVQAEQKVRVKLAAYPFQKYGMLDGVVKQVSADAQEKPESGNPAIKSAQQAAYRALINLGSGHLESQGQAASPRPRHAGQRRDPPRHAQRPRVSPLTGPEGRPRGGAGVVRKAEERYFASDILPSVLLARGAKTLT